MATAKKKQAAQPAPAPAASKVPATSLPVLSKYPEALALVEAGLVLVEKAEKYQGVVDDTNEAVLAELRARLNGHISRVDEERLELTRPMREQQASINDAFRDPIDSMRQQLRRVDKVLRDYLLEKQRKAEAARQAALEEQRRQAEEQRRREAEAAAANRPPPAPLPPLAPPPPEPSRSVTGHYGSSTGLRDNWKWRVKDIAQVPEAFLVPPEDRCQKATLNAMARSQKDKASVPGIEFYNEPGLQSREAM